MAERKSTAEGARSLSTAAGIRADHPFTHRVSPLRDSEQELLRAADVLREALSSSRAVAETKVTHTQRKSRVVARLQKAIVLTQKDRCAAIRTRLD